MDVLMFIFQYIYWVKLQKSNSYQFVVFKSIYYNSDLMDSEKVKILTLHNQDTKQEDQYALYPRPLGEGKYAKVYKATNVRDPKKVFAVKVISITSEEAKKDYQKELKIIKNLPRCPNIVNTHKQHLSSENNLYIFQQYCESGTLSTYRIEKIGKPFTEAEIYDLFYQLTNGLVLLLQAGIIHQDIKPVNIMRKGPAFKLGDFGVSEIEVQYVQSTTRKGTISYMPPEKLKTKKFIPSDRSDIYSLGICFYETIFGFHPYLKKKTGNYKEYLTFLDQATLRPIPILLKKLGSTSLKLENLIKFLQRMIDLNPKTRVNLKELKQFIATTEPFNGMKPIDEENLQSFSTDKKLSKQALEEKYINIFESVIRFKKQNQENNGQVFQSFPTEKIDPFIAIKARIIERYYKQRSYVTGIISLLINSIDVLRKQNFCSVNLNSVQKNIFDIDLSKCKISRYIKYLIYQFCLTMIKRFKERYEPYIDEDAQYQLFENKNFLENQFNKFLIECDFQNKELLADQLKNRDNNLQLWMQIKLFYMACINQISFVEENKKWFLLSAIYCIYIPKILNLFKNISSIFSQTTIEEQQKQPISGDTSLEDGERILAEVNQIQKMKKESLRKIVQEELGKLGKNIVFELGDESEEIQILTEQELL